tara:strand:- start:1142 stop:1471 length:330 start_codon:yes stop_codon:yes gene_type:complete
MNLSKYVKKFGFALVVTLIILIFIFFILGISGMMAALGLILLFILPTYFIIDNYDLQEDQKVIFSFFIGVGIFPSIAYWLGLLISFKIAILISFIVLILIGILIRKFRK